MDPGGSKDNSKDFTFAKLSDLNLPVTFRISQLEGTRKPRPYSDLLENPDLRFAGVQSEGLSDLYVTCQLVADNKPLTIPYRTAFKAFKSTYTWNEWITFPVKYCDLPLNSQITLTVWDIANPRTAVPVGGTTFRMFGKKWTLRRGKHRLLLWPGQEADGSVESRTPSKVGIKDEMGRLEKLVKRYERDDMPKVDWLDTLTFRKMEEIHAAETQKSESLFLYLDLPRFDFPVIFSESRDIAQSTIAPTQPSNAQAAIAPNPNAPPTLNIQNDAHIWQIIDPEVARENPVEDKHRRLVRSHRSGPLDRELKPNATDRDNLTKILSYPPTRLLSADDKDLIWRFRFYLTRDKKGLTKFLKSVTWKDPSEVKQAVEVLLPLWTDIGTDDALELLGPTSVDARVRKFAVKQLARSDDDDLVLYLLQLVQALRFENVSGDQRSTRTKSGGTSAKEESALADFLIERGVRNFLLGNRLHWYLMVELQDKINGKMYARVAYRFMQRLVEVEGGSARRELLRRQGELLSTLSARAKELRTSKDPRPKKIDKLRAFIADPKHNLLAIPPLPHPLNAKVEIVGIISEKSSVFKSNLFPLLLFFQTKPQEDGTPGEEYPVIFKNGDDMRQDQLVIQLFTLMDRLLRKENLDLKLSPYDVLATGTLEGMAQFIPSKTIAAIMSEQGALLNYLRANSPDEGSVGTYGVKPSVIDTFVRSCAGYCVVTYILGVGDRHLDNLLLAPDGHFFHGDTHFPILTPGSHILTFLTVDFGYIFGRDPKPFPPPVKLCREMVDAMGGAQSPHYARFRNLCFTAFAILRKSASLIMNLVGLMVDANIPDIKHRDVQEQLQDKFRLDLTEEEAIKHFETLLNETSYFTVVLDRIHDLAQYWRS
ncbi:Phosphatidylinositol (PI) 3-kinase [Tulasnella sp. JGI-2019a]|nr:Phosphatidylinositol (PI) 3-kinase [Tulasnella sp. JGI-2019a]